MPFHQRLSLTRPVHCAVLSNTLTNSARALAVPFPSNTLTNSLFLSYPPPQQKTSRFLDTPARAKGPRFWRRSLEESAQLTNAESCVSSPTTCPARLTVYVTSPLPSAGQGSRAICIGGTWRVPVYPRALASLSSTSVRMLFVGISSELFSHSRWYACALLFVGISPE